ncbi:MAG: hypothetical protein Q8Q28_18845 [Pseudomonadota bacterium]|nr:hypothetical protein [Pseudomonadota bacterium]
MGFSLQAMAVEVVVNRGVATTSLAQASARALFGLRLTKWPDGRPVRVFVLPDGHPVHVALCKEELNSYPYQLRQAWDRLVYSGMAQAPIEVATEEEMISRVATTPGALGYVRKVKANDPVKSIDVE